MLGVEASIAARKLFSSLAAHFDVIVGDLLSLLFQNGNYIDSGAASQRNQQQLHRRSGEVPLRISFDRLCVPGWRDADKKFSARELDDCFAFFISHSYIASSNFNKRITWPFQNADHASYQSYLAMQLSGT